MIAAIQVREAARYQWKTLLFPSLAIAVRGDKRPGPCPCCGGKDRFFCDDKNGSGSWFCRQCDPQAGDGFALVQKVCGCSFPETLRQVAGILGLDASTSSATLRLRPAPQPAKLDRVALAWRYDLAALDLRLRAERIIETSLALIVGTFTESELDQALSHVAQTYADVERAELFEMTADNLRRKDFLERDHARHKRVA